ncbi:MAG: hypothetical protein KAX45_05985 [Chitinophagaceae bacterium]|nr:hypothetical protein [Chitinophagaceae bacterium]MBP6590322.1 hypothetical protein [Chitinophagaceae bacterium]MBP8244066.1 hypothetical protein [Chitinophagaceae bacterium]
MISSNRDILVLQQRESVTAEELNRLHTVLQQVETDENFCTVHELVDRNRITRRPKKILKESRFYFLRPFRFLINKN